MVVNMEKIKHLKAGQLNSEEKYMYAKGQASAAGGTSESCICEPKNGIIYVLLGWLLGLLGAHNFYAGYYWRGVFQAVISLASWLFMFIPLIPVAAWVIFEILLVNRGADGQRFSGNYAVIQGLRIAFIIWLAAVLFFGYDYLKWELFSGISPVTVMTNN